MTTQINIETKPAHKLRPGDKVFIYGTVPVTIITVECLPAFRPAKTVAITYRRDLAKGHLLGQMTAQASQTFPVWDDGEAF